MKVHDVMALGGVALVVGGSAWMLPAAGMVVLGVILLVTGTVGALRGGG